MAAEETIDIKTIEEWQRILDKTSQIEDNETFLDLCHYKDERFEEICSRVLAFFLNPNKKHGFRDLWFKALCKTMKLNNIDVSQINIKTEEYTYNTDDKEKGRIDLVLKNPTFVIAIENKINAKLYNKLKKYSEHINNTYNYITENNRHFFVLTAHTLSKDDKETLAKKENEEYKVIKYDDLFKHVESLIGKYVAKGNSKYLYFMFDFIQTVKNRANMEINEYDKFFTRNRREIDAFLATFDSWKDNNPISDLEKRLNNKEWKSLNGWNLRVFFTDVNIASNYEFDSNNNPYGKFRIYITTGNRKWWENYKNIIEKKYPKCHLDNGEENTENRVYYHLKPIELKDFNDDFDAYQEEIIKKLKECYDFLKGLTENQQSSTPETSGATS